MHLNENDAEKFYKLWLGLLEYTNRRYNVAPKLKSIRNASQLNPTDLVPIRNKLWEDDYILNEYIKENPYSMEISELELIGSWKRRVSGKFILLKHLKRYSVFLHSEKDGKIYGVIGITNLIAEMFDTSQLPVCLDAILLPFEDKIIYDSLLIPYNVHFGSGVRRGFNDEYCDLKREYGIITAL